MEQQYTPTYHRMWNRDFSLLIAAELLLCIACYMTIPFLPYRLFKSNYVDASLASLTMVLFVTGIFVSGFFGCWLIQRYRRNKVFGISALCLAATILALSVFDNPQNKYADENHIMALLGVCTFGGMVFGQSKRVLSCTLLIDKTVSCHRTEANYAAIWIARLTIVAGPIIAIQLRNEVQNTMFYGIGAAMAIVAAALVMMVNFPFRAPEEGTKLISTDRFLLPQGWNVSIVIACMSAALGLTMVTHTSTEFFTSLAVGFAIAILTLRFPAVRMGRFTSMVGNVCILTAVLAMTLHNGMLDDTLKPMVLGLGFGLTASEQLYKLLDRSNHCQRSTAESTYFMASDGGLFLGIAAGCLVGTYAAEQAATGEHGAILLFAIASIMCSINSLMKKKHTEFHA